MAYSGLADCYGQLCITFAAVTAKDGWARAKAAAAAAVELDPDLAEAHTSMAFVRAYCDWDWKAAEREFQQAIELDPSYWVAPYWLGITLTARGLYQDADRWINLAWEMEPLSPIIAHGAAFNFIASRKYGDAINVCLNGIDISPDYPLLRLWLGVAYEQQSRCEEAIAEFEKALQLLPGQPVAVGPLAHAYSGAGRQTEVLKMLHDLLESHSRRQVDAYSIAIVFVALGQDDEAIEWLDKACNSHTGMFTHVANGDPRLDRLRSDPRFEQLLQRMRPAR